MHKGTEQIKAMCSILTVGVHINITAAPFPILCYQRNTPSYRNTNRAEDFGETLCAITLL